MNIPNDIWYNVFYFLTQRSQSKFSCLLNLYNLSTEEIELMFSSYNLWFDTAKKGYTKLMNFLIKASGVDVNVQDSYGRTALHCASMYGHKECVELLIKADADINIQGRSGNTALHFASNYNSYKESVELLINASGVNVNIQNNYGDTALHNASRYCNKDCIELLIKAGTDLNIQDNIGWTSLHNASKYSGKECAELLIKAGTDLNIQNNDGSTALHYACYHSRKEIVELLIKSGANGEYFKKK